MKIVAWGFSMPALSEALAREVARLPGRADLLLQIDPDTRTIDFSSVRIAEFLRTDFRQLEGLLRALEKESGVAVVFDLWRFLFSEGFDETLPLLRKAAALAERCVLLSPARITHESALFPFGIHARGFTPDETQDVLKWTARIRRLHESVLNAQPNTTLLVSAPPLEAFWGVLGTNTLAPLKTFGLKFAPRELRRGGAVFSSFPNIAREVAHIVGQPTGKESTPWIAAADAVTVGLSEDAARGFDCGWKRYVGAAVRRTDASVLEPAYSLHASRAALARFLFSLGLYGKCAEVPETIARAPALGLLFPSPAGEVG